MAAPSVATMIGAEISATHITAEGKSSETGKSFAASLDERIAADADVAAKSGAEMNAQQIQAGTKILMSEAGQNEGREPVTTANSSQALGNPAQAMSIPVAKVPVASQVATVQAVAVATGAKAPAAAAPKAVVVQETQLDATTAVQTSDVAIDDSGKVDVKPLDGAAIATPKMACVSNEQAQSVKAQTPGEIPRDAQAGAVSSVTGVKANTQVTHPMQESVPASSEKNASTSSGEDAAPTKETAKKHATVKAEASMRTVEAGTGSAIFTHATVAIAPAAVVAQPVAPRGVTDSTSQAAVGTAAKQGTAAAVVAGTKVVVVPAGSHQGSNVQHSAPEKPAGDGVGVSSHVEPGQQAAQKNVPTPAKPMDSSTIAALSQAAAQTVKSSAKSQTADAAVPVSHSTGAAGTTVNAHGAATALPVPIALAQKVTTGGAPATLSSSHIGNGELSGAAGAQVAALNDSHKTLVATPTVLEIGIPNGTQGWLKVRAELTGGGVNASLSAASPAGQEMLHRELPALTTYLQQEKVAVNSLVVQAPVAGGFRGLPGGTGGYSGGQPQQQSQGSSGRDNFVSAGGTALSEMNQVAEELPVSMQYPSGGGWLSVRA